MTVAALPPADTLRRHRFATMGVTVELLLESDREVERAFAAAEREFRRLDAIFSRFDSASELSRLNRAGTLRCSRELVDVVALALRARDHRRPLRPHRPRLPRRDGLRPHLPRAPRRCRSPGALPAPCGGDVGVDVAEGVVSLGPGARIDLGGIVKGYAAERACDPLGELGGRHRRPGTPAAGAWTIQVDAPEGSLVLALRRGGLATSGRDHRRWRRNGVELHHLIDPFTGAPSASDLVTVTAVGEDAVAAEVRAKALFLAARCGSDAAASQPS